MNTNRLIIAFAAVCMLVVAITFLQIYRLPFGVNCHLTSRIPYDAIPDKARGLVDLTFQSGLTHANSFIQKQTNEEECQTDAEPKEEYSEDSVIQESKSPFGLFVISAFYTQNTVLSSPPEVRVAVSMANNNNMNDDDDELYCHIWYMGKKTPIVGKGTVQAGLISTRPTKYVNGVAICPLISSYPLPRGVGLSKSPCPYVQNIKPIFIPVFIENESGDVGMCVSNFNWETHVERFIEFIEIHKHLGVDHFTIYVQNSTEMSELLRIALENYEEEGSVKRIVFGIGVTGLKSQDVDQMVLHDCVHRNMMRFKYIVLTSVHGVLLPTVSQISAAFMDDALDGPITIVDPSDHDDSQSIEGNTIIVNIQAYVISKSWNTQKPTSVRNLLNLQFKECHEKNIKCLSLLGAFSQIRKMSEQVKGSVLQMQQRVHDRVQMVRHLYKLNFG